MLFRHQDQLGAVVTAIVVVGRSIRVLCLYMLHQHHANHVRRDADSDCLRRASPAPRREPSQVACKSGHVEVVRALVETGASLTMADSSGNTPLHW